MYEAFYGFKEKPFSLLPDPSFLYLGRHHSMAYSMLEYGVLSQAGFTVITGEVGCGKTTLIRHLLDQLDGDVSVGLITNTAGARADLLKRILLSFKQEYKGKEAVELQETFEDFLIGEYAAGRRTVLIVDEAQNLGIETLEELRMLSNINAEKDLILQLILVGQPQLKAKLERPELQQFAQRIAVSYHLGPLAEDETIAYIQHRLRHAGGSPGLLSPDACHLVFQHTRGVPRLINVLCDTALVYGYAEQFKEIGEELLQDVIRDRSKGIQSSSPPPSASFREAETGGGKDRSNVTVFDREQARELFGDLRRK
jgi:type II secretory pathway predicted ATPase ExeA